MSIDTARRVAAIYGLEEWATPIFEDTRVFSRSLGDTSDVVMKEMYTFTDRGGDSLTLRPEGTAGVCRALVTNGLTQSLPQKVFYAGPMFRYERPQKGRYRQFHQIGAELIGPAEPLADAEIIACGWDILAALGIAEDVVLEVNTLGDRESRDAYRAALVEYFTAHQAGLSEDSLAAAGAQPAAHSRFQGRGRPPHHRRRADIHAHLTPEARRVLRAAESLPGRLRRAVRGQSRASCAGSTITATPRSSSSPPALGAQGTVMAGGRYDGLVAEMGGPATPGGRLGGRHRAAVHAADRGAGGAAGRSPWCRSARRPRRRRLPCCERCARAGIRAEMAYRGNMKRRLERANRIGARAAIILGETELARGVAQVKDFSTGTQQEVPLAELIAKLQ